MPNDVLVCAFSRGMILIVLDLFCLSKPKIVFVPQLVVSVELVCGDIISYCSCF